MLSGTTTCARSSAEEVMAAAIASVAATAQRRPEIAMFTFNRAEPERGNGRAAVGYRDSTNAGKNSGLEQERRFDHEDFSVQGLSFRDRFCRWHRAGRRGGEPPPRHRHPLQQSDVHAEHALGERDHAEGSE